MLQLLLNAEVHAPQALGRRHMLVAGGRIVWIGADAPRLPAEMGASEVDLAGDWHVRNGEQIVRGTFENTGENTGEANA